MPAKSKSSSAPSKKTKASSSATEATTPQKVHIMPLPKLMDSSGKALPSMKRMGSDGFMFNGIIHFAGQRAKENLSGDIKAQTKEICDMYDRLLAEGMSDKTKITRADIYLRDKTMLKDALTVWEEWIGGPKYAPACNFVLSEFLDDSILIQIALIAVVSNDDGAEGSEATDTGAAGEVSAQA